MTKHTSAHLKILVGPVLVGGFCQKKDSKLSANIFHPKKEGRVGWCDVKLWSCKCCNQVICLTIDYLWTKFEEL